MPRKKKQDTPMIATLEEEISTEQQQNVQDTPEVIDEQEISTEVEQQNNQDRVPTIHDVEWTDYVLSFLTEDEKIMGNPTTDGLRRVFEQVMNCEIIQSDSKVVQCPSRENEMRATVEFMLSFKINNATLHSFEIKSVSGSADVYWGNCDKIFRNHPVAVAETRAEGRALRRALRLRKVVAAEEIATEIEDHPDGNNINKITSNQINFIDVMAQRLNINVVKLLEVNNLAKENVYDMLHEEAVAIIRHLSKHQQNFADIPEEILGYSSDWK